MTIPLRVLLSRSVGPLRGVGWACGPGKRGMLLSLTVMKGGEPNLVCRAPIGCVGKGCLRSLCSTAPHKAAPKVTFVEDVFVVGIDSNTVWHTPSLPVRLVTPGLKEAWLALTYSLDTWVEKFEAVKPLFDETGLPITAAALEGQEEFRK